MMVEVELKLICRLEDSNMKQLDDVVTKDPLKLKDFDNSQNSSVTSKTMYILLAVVPSALVISLLFYLISGGGSTTTTTSSSDDSNSKALRLGAESTESDGTPSNFTRS